MQCGSVKKGNVAQSNKGMSEGARKSASVTRVCSTRDFGDHKTELAPLPPSCPRSDQETNFTPPIQQTLLRNKELRTHIIIILHPYNNVRPQQFHSGFSQICTKNLFSFNHCSLLSSALLKGYVRDWMRLTFFSIIKVPTISQFKVYFQCK